MEQLPTLQNFNLVFLERYKQSMLDSGSSGRMLVGVRLSPSPPNFQGFIPVTKVSCKFS
jgi:hypothetical protein